MEPPTGCHQKTYSAEYVVNSAAQPLNIIIPHFNKYPLHLSKQHSFLILVSVIDILTNKAHYDKDIFAKPTTLVFSMNDVTNRTIDQEKKSLLRSY